jgi:hypothetical protein
MALVTLTPIQAVTMQEYDFDGNFLMDVPEGCSFVNRNSFLGIDIYPTKVYQDFENSINISFANVYDDDKYYSDMINALKGEPDINLTQNGDRYLIKTEKFNIVLFKKDHNIVAISSAKLDFDTLNAMADSFKIK